MMLRQTDKSCCQLHYFVLHMAMAILFMVPVPYTRSTTERLASQPLTFIERALGQSGPPSPSLLSTGPWASPAPTYLTFMNTAQANPARALTSISQTPHFYWQAPHGQVMAILAIPENCSVV